MVVKKCWIVLALTVMLTGCSAQQTFETVLDALEPVQPQMRQVQLSVPDDASVLAMSAAETQRLYLCEGYTVTVQILSSGDLKSTFEEITGFGPEQLNPIKTQTQETVRYDCVWTAAGEGGDQVGRATVLDDGSYHYAVTVMADASVSGDLTGEWNDLFDSVKLVSTD